MQLPIQIPGIAPLAQWHPGPHGPGPHGPGPHGPHWGGGPHWGAGPTGGMGMGGAGLGVGGWWLVLLTALLIVGLVAAALYLTARAGGDGTADDGARATLRERYAAGDLDDEEFERRRDRLTGRAG
ncbi:SHOCT domain-containing protein [Haloplanus halophilus]|uniref:SHOCT domain-containing protein n=1 Tax=Haloplanus halophilus TaxID=2949993 RepID=UPI00203C7B06|nr:SHOCT domain-containing protein [Haloplanus sp. GDY1]